MLSPPFEPAATQPTLAAASAGRPEAALASAATPSTEAQGAKEAEGHTIAGEAFALPVHLDAHAPEAARRPWIDVEDDVDGKDANDCVYEDSSTALEAVGFAAAGAEEQGPLRPSKTAYGAEGRR